MMIIPKVSVIVPIYNKEEYLKECLDSLIHQSLKEIEIICIDDGSTDDSLTILTNYSRKDSRIKIFSQENSGPGSARNKGINEANGEYIAFIDADDWIELDSLEKLYVNAKQYGSDLVLFNAIEHLPNNKCNPRIYFKESINGKFTYNQQKNLVLNNYLIVCTKLHKNTFLQKNDIYFSESDLFEDVYFHIKSVLEAKSISYLNEILYNYRRTQTNTRQSKSIKSRKSFVFLDILVNIKELLKDKNIFNDFKINYYEFKLTELFNLFNNIENEYKSEFFYLLKSDFEKDEISFDTLSQLSKNNQEFYNNILNTKELYEYDNSTDKQTKIEHSFKNRVKGIFKKLF